MRPATTRAWRGCPARRGSGLRDRLLTRAVSVLALAGLLALGGPACVQAQEPASAELRGPGSSVPYVAQGPLLCGGASAAMLQRYWGELGVYAEDYASLLRPEEGGIRTGELADALAERGYDVRVRTDEARPVLERVASGIPVVVLLESGEARYHYVVVVAVGPGTVRIHDPLDAPGRVLDRDDFLRRWAATDHWAMVALPAMPAPEAPVRDAGDADEPEGEGNGHDLPPALRQGLDLLRRGEHERAEATVAGWLHDAAPGAPRRPTALDMLGTARYLSGDEAGALAAWNRQDRPVVDLVSVTGLEHLRWATVADALPVAAREVLSPADLHLARRRVLQLPSVSSGLVQYRPLRNGSVALEVAVSERSRLPLGLLPAGEVVGDMIFGDELDLTVGPFLGMGERWDVEVAWEDAQEIRRGGVEIPSTALDGVVRLEGGWLRERYEVDGDRTPTRTRRWATATFRRWMAPSLRLGLRGGLERGDDGGRVGRAGATFLATALSDDIRFGGELDGWFGGAEPFARFRVSARGRRPSAGHAEWRVRVGASVVTDGAPPTIWDGVGGGGVRELPLRGHELEDGNRIQDPLLGPTVFYGTLAHAWFLDVAPARLGVSLFVDVARVREGLGGLPPRGFVDPGIQLELQALGEQASLSLAHGDGSWRLDAEVGSSTLPWLSVP